MIQCRYRKKFRPTKHKKIHQTYAQISNNNGNKYNIRIFIKAYHDFKCIFSLDLGLGSFPLYNFFRKLNDRTLYPDSFRASISHVVTLTKNSCFHLSLIGVICSFSLSFFHPKMTNDPVSTKIRSQSAMNRTETNERGNSYKDICFMFCDVHAWVGARSKFLAAIKISSTYDLGYRESIGFYLNSFGCYKTAGGWSTCVTYGLLKTVRRI